MNYESLFNKFNVKKVAKVCIVGANGGFGYTFLSQIPLMKNLLSIRAVVDLDINKSLVLLEELGYDRAKLYPCRNADEVAKAPADGIIVLEDAYLAPKTDVDVLVEATGIPEMSAEIAEMGILGGKHVCMVSKEADCIVGPYLTKLAASKGLIYSVVIGDQPANLINWLSFLKTLGMDIVCAGKSSEYDFVYDLDSSVFQYQDKTENIPELKKYWKYEGPATLKERSKLLSKYQQYAIPDYCEMNIVCNATGLTPSYDEFVYPVCNVTELAEIYQLKEDGGVISHMNSIDAFNNFRRPDEASFAGGVFAVVKCTNERVWNLLAQKGHVISRSRKYGCLYLPYHYMGVEAPMSVVEAFFFGISGYAQCNNVATMTCVTQRDFKAGEKLSMLTNHRYIDGVQVKLEKSCDLPENVAPYYLVTDKTLVTDVPKGTLITMDMLDLSHSSLARMIKAIG